MLIAAVQEYVALKRATGFLYRVHKGLLFNFAVFAQSRGDTHVRSDTAIAWASLAPSAPTRTGRLRIVVGFARHAAIEDRRHEIPPESAFGPRARRPTPHIFSAEEIARILAVTSTFGPTGSLRAKTYTTAYALIAATGLRASEAVALRMDDVTADGLVIRKTKFRKSRLVPLHPTTKDALEGYIAERRRASKVPQVFISIYGGALGYPSLSATFAEVLRSIGMRAATGRGPRLHDLRHTFAVRSLEQCVGGREAISRHMLALSTYLGHSCLANTYWYLQATPTLMVRIAQDCEAAMHQGGLP